MEKDLGRHVDSSGDVNALQVRREDDARPLQVLASDIEPPHSQNDPFTFDIIQSPISHRMRKQNALTPISCGKSSFQFNRASFQIRGLASEFRTP